MLFSSDQIVCPLKTTKVYLCISGKNKCGFLYCRLCNIEKKGIYTQKNILFTTEM